MKTYYAQKLVFPGESKIGDTLNIYDNEFVEPITSSKHPEIAEKIDTILEGNQAVWVINDGMEGNNHVSIWTNAWYQDIKLYIPELIMLFAELKDCSPMGFDLFLNYFGKADSYEWERSRFTIELKEY